MASVVETRREVLKVGALNALGLTLTGWLRRRSAAAEPGTGPAIAPRATACILLWLDGGPSHLDTFDPKPDAAAEVRGPFGSIPTALAGVRISETLPRTATLLDQVAVLRSVTSPLGEHNFGSHYLLTGYRPSPAVVYPAVGAVLTHLRQEVSPLPRYVAVPDFNPAAGEGYLPAANRPFAVGGDPGREDFTVRDLDAFPAVTPERLSRRQEYLQRLDAWQRSTAAQAITAGTADPAFDQAFRLLSSRDARQAFDLAAEPADTRQRYGPRTIGQSCLLARRLVEAGVPFVTVTDRGWDTHDKLVLQLQEGYTGGAVGKTPMFDVAFSALLDDLQQRGLLATTLVLAMGEFGRTPRLNTIGGRDHWPRVFSVVLAGGGVRGGQVLGASDALGESPAERPVTPADLVATIYTLLGIDPALELQTADGRPVRVSTGETIPELL